MDSSGRRYLCIQIRAVPKLMLIEAQILELLGPVRVGIPQALDIDAAREAAVNRCLDELGSKECEREREIDLAHRASLSFRKLLSVDGRTFDDFVEPSVAARDRADQTNASLGAVGPNIFPDRPMRVEDFSESF